MIQKIKDWLIDGPSFKVIVADPYPKIIKRLRDGKEFERLFFYYEYTIFNGRYYYYDIMYACDDMKNVQIRIYDENKQYLRQIKINVNHLI